MLYQMLKPGFTDLSFRVLQREFSRQRAAVREEARERIAGLLAIALVVASLYGMMSGYEFSLVEESKAAESITGAKALEPPRLNVHAVLQRLETDQLSRSEIRTLQRQLRSKGFAAGPLDGIAGRRTLSALNAYRESLRLGPVLAVTRETIGALRNP